MIIPEHLKNLRESGLTDGTIDRAGIFSATHDQVRQLFGAELPSGLVFPYGGTFHRVRLDIDDKRKYRQPAGSKNQLYLRGLDVLGDRDAVLRDSSIPLYVTEGEKKALAGCQAGMPTVAVSGVWSWKTRIHGQSLDITDLDRIDWKGRRVTLVFDSDADTNPAVSQAEHQLAKTLGQRGGKVFTIRLPGSDTGGKVGLDDFLVTHGPEAFTKLPMVSVLDTQAEPTFLRMDQLLDAYVLAAKTEGHRMRLNLPGIDDDLRGMAPGEVMTVLGRSGVGKTAVGLNLVELMTGGEKPALVFSLEMGGTELFERMVSLQTGMAGQDVEQAVRLREHGDFMPRLIETASRWQQVVVVDRSCTLRQIDTLIGAAPKAGLWTEPLQLVLIDYLGMVTTDTAGKSYEVVSEMAKEVKRIAKRHRVRVLLMCQVSRDGGTGGEPISSKMARDSGVIEESADYLVGIWRPELYEPKPGDLRRYYTDEQKAALKGVMKFRILKNRGGPAGREFDLGFETPSLRLSGRQEGLPA